VNHNETGIIIIIITILLSVNSRQFTSDKHSQSILLHIPFRFYGSNYQETSHGKIFHLTYCAQTRRLVLMNKGQKFNAKNVYHSISLYNKATNNVRNSFCIRLTEILFLLSRQAHSNRLNICCSYVFTMSLVMFRHYSLSRML